MILVTGSSGLVGSHLIASLLQKGNTVKALIRNEESKAKIVKVVGYFSNQPDDLLANIHWVYGDIADQGSLLEAFENVKQVYNCAAVVSFDKKDRKTMLETNIRGTANVVNACLDSGIEKLVHVSSIAAVKGNSSDEIITEDSGWPTGHTLNYSYSKTQGEYEVWRGITEGLNAVIINPSIILGPGNWNSGSSKFFSTVYDNLKYFTRGITGFVDVCDVVEVMISLMESDIHSQRFIVSAENISYEQLFKSIAKSLGVKEPAVYASPALTSFAVYLDAIKSAISFSRPLITKETAKSSHKVQYYSSEKLLKSLEYSFNPVNNAIERIAKQFLVDLNR
jgi:dihydroflavonol-4-reductase